MGTSAGFWFKEEFANGREYYRHHGQQLANLPWAPADQPSAEFIRWHNKFVYVE